MGNDGGSIPKRRELVREAAKIPSATDIKESLQEKQEYYWSTDPLSNKALHPPIVSDHNGRLYNKQSILEFLLPSEDKVARAEHEKVLAGAVRSLKDVVEIHFYSDNTGHVHERNGNSAPSHGWVCPITNKALGPGSKAVYLVPCGHAFTAEGVMEVAGECITCGKRYAENDVIPILPTRVEDIARLQLRIKSLRERGLTHSLKEAKKVKGDKKRKRGDENEEKFKDKGSSSAPAPAKARILPYHAKTLDKRDLEEYEALFASYLDIQKELNIDQLSEREVHGRWKSFIHKWNHGELVEGWYDPSTKAKAEDRARDLTQADSIEQHRHRSEGRDSHKKSQGNDENSDVDEFGPALPDHLDPRARVGPSMPSGQDLQLRDELHEEDRMFAREDLAYARKQDRKLQKDLLDDLVPRADPGSRERQLEKKREVAASNKAFADRKSPTVEEFGDRDLMGEDSLESFKRRKIEQQKKKTEREIKKEEIWRARAADREEKLAKRREKEEATMDYLKKLAKERFG